jgi:hypothetical protein
MMEHGNAPENQGSMNKEDSAEVSQKPIRHKVFYMPNN